MRIAILADIHSNLAALDAVSLDIEQKGGVDEIWCLGDIVGYGPDPHPCLEFIRRNASLCVAGNHDLAAIGKTSTDQFNTVAAEAARWTATRLSPPEKQFLENLPLQVERGDFTLVHGSPRDPVWEYVMSENIAEENLDYLPTRHCLVGHTHIPLVFECDDAHVCSVKHPSGASQTILGEKRFILNPGGVGQPRDRDPRAGYAIYDNDVREITFYRVDYDILITQKHMQEAGLPSWLIHRLSQGL